MIFLDSSGFPPLRLGEAAPFQVGGENTDPVTGVELPELCRDCGKEAVEAKMEESDGLGNRNGKSDSDEEGEILRLGRTIELSDSV